MNPTCVQVMLYMRQTSVKYEVTIITLSRITLLVTTNQKVQPILLWVSLGNLFFPTPASTLLCHAVVITVMSMNMYMAL